MSLSPNELRELEANEAWLAGHATPAPNPAAMQRLKAAVGRELLAQRRARPWSHRLGAAGGAWAAAAMLFLCVGLVWQQMRDVRPAAPSLLVQIESPLTDSVETDGLELSLLATEAGEASTIMAFGDETAIDRLVDELNELESTAQSPWDS